VSIVLTPLKCVAEDLFFVLALGSFSATRRIISRDDGVFLISAENPPREETSTK
jgi:hypothetical protein